MQRVLYLDRFRFLVVTLAITAHVLSTYEVRETELSDSVRYLYFLTRTATPSLLVLLGIMVHLVYARPFTSDARNVAKRILYRSVQCYLAFLVIVILNFLMTDQDAAHTLHASVFLMRVSNGTIFQLYVLLLPVTIALLWAQRAWGPSSLAAAIVLVWLADPLLSTVAEVWPARLAELGEILFGHGGHWGPSAFHGISLVAAGMLIGAAFSGRDNLHKLKVELLTLCGITLLALVIVGSYILQEGAHSFAGSIVHFGLFRSNNEIEYYAYGWIAVLVLLGGTKIVSSYVPERYFYLVDRIGAYTLTYFLLGEVFMLIFPSGVISQFPLLVLIVLGYVGLAGCATLIVRHVHEKRPSRHENLKRPEPPVRSNPVPRNQFSKRSG